MTPIEIFALIVLVAAAIKIIVILLKPAVWISIIKKVYINPLLTMIAASILAAVVLSYLLLELTIVQIFASILFIALLSTIGIAAYKEEVTAIAEKMLRNKKVLKKAWLAILIWIILIIWGIAELLA